MSMSMNTNGFISHRNVLFFISKSYLDVYSIPQCNVVSSFTHKKINLWVTDALAGTIDAKVMLDCV